MARSVMRTPFNWHASCLILFYLYSTLYGLSPSDEVSAWHSDVEQFVNQFSLPNWAPEKDLASSLKCVVDSLDSHTVDPSTSTEMSRATAACQVLQMVLNGTPGSGGYVDSTYGPLYNNRTDINWSAVSRLPAQCFVAPETAQDLANIMHVITFFEATFAIRGGGHNPNVGWSSIDSRGILIDVHKLNQLSLSSDKDVISVGPGNRWKDVYSYLVGSGVSAIGGRVPEVGVSGLTLGGGLASFSSKYGLVADNVKNFEVVLANSSIVNANIEQNPDLFYVLKGGGPNFGIVTKIDFYAANYDKVWFQVNVYNNTHIEELLEALVTYQRAAENDDKSGLTFTPNAATTTVGFSYAAPQESPAVFNSFYGIPVLQTAFPSTIGTQEDLANTNASPVGGPPTNYDIISVVTQFSLGFYMDIHSKFLQLAAAAQASIGAIMYYSIQPIQSSVAEVGRMRGGNVMGTQAIEQEWFTAAVIFFNDTHSATAHKFITELGSAVVNASTAHDLFLPLINPNDATFDQDPLSTFGSENTAKLEAVSAKYDPNQVFQRLQNAGFLINKA